MAWHHKPGTGQSRLNDRELQRLPCGNQYTEDLSVVEWQVIKAAARRHQVRDWTSIADSSLTYTENVELMRKRGTNSGPTMRELQHTLR